MTQIQSGFEATNLVFSYDGKPILKDINLKIKPGEFVCLLGESGSGKTTLLNLLAGLTKPNEGHVYWNGKEIEKPSSERSVVFQDYTLFPWLTLLQNVSLAIKKTKKVKGSFAKHLAEEYLNLVGLSGSLHKYPFELSGGMRQRGARPCNYDFVCDARHSRGRLSRKSNYRFGIDARPYHRRYSFGFSSEKEP